jgi:hypothetical protein
VAEDGSKRPDVSSWQPYQTTRPTVAEMRAFDFAQRSGFGLIAGPVSGHCEAWDFDDLETYQRFVAAAQACGLGDVAQRLIDGYEDATPNDGRRWIVRYPETIAWRDCTLARRPGRDGEPKVKTLIELPTFAILAPSNGSVHPTGKPYVRLSGDFDTIANYTAEERADLLALARSFDAMPRPEPRTTTKSSAGTRPGDDFSRRTTWPELLEPAGWTRVYDRGDVTAWRRPGKAHGISATTNVGGSDLFYCFSSSTEFQPDKSYTKFGAYSVLHHDGDLSAAAKALAGQGYGSNGEPGTTPDASDTQARTLTLTPASTIKVRPVRWLWQDRLALGTFALMAGREGVGKTTAAYTLGASLTRGTLPGAYFGTPRAVVIAATEDSWEHTIVPRLMAADADLDRVYRVDVVTSEGVGTAISLPRDLAALERLIREYAVGQIILDPLLSRLDTAIDTHKDAEVRLALEPLVSLADATGTCVLGIIHCNKSASSDALTMIMASRAFVAVARAVLFVMIDPEDDTRRLLGQPKNNLGRGDLPSLMFTIEGAHVTDTAEGEVWTGKLVWAGQTDRTIRDAVEAATESAGDRSASSEAADWLHDYLTEQGGTRDSATIQDEGRKAGHGRIAVQRARVRLRLRVAGLGFPRRTYWSLPPSQSVQPVVSHPGESALTDISETTDANRVVQSSQSSQSSQLQEPPARPRQLREEDDDAEVFG